VQPHICRLQYVVMNVLFIICLYHLIDLSIMCAHVRHVLTFSLSLLSTLY
jgi:hypothetical protein